MNQPPAIVARRKLSDWYRPNHIHPQNIPEAIVRTVLDRVDPQDLQTFLEPSIESIPSPLSLKNIRKATQLFIEALTNRKKIVIVGDYDADGICSVTLIIRFLKEIRYDNAQYFIPNRFDHGYGLTDTALPLILNLNPDLIITVDNGISAQKEIDHLMKRGISVIVTDHHALPTNSLPNCTILNPKQRECRFPFKDISGVGVTYLFLIAIRMEMRSQGFWSDRRSEPNLLKHLDLVALGTVTDQVPLLGLNRIFVRNGLKQMTKQIQRGYGSRFFFYLKMFAEHRAIRFFNCESIGYYLGPLLNAAGRMEDASLAVRFLLSDSESEANKNLKALNRLNNKRKRLQDSMTKKAQKQAASLAKLHSGILICDDTFHEGLIGIVANRLSDLFQLPSIVATAEKNGNIKSSCRSKHINILAVLKECDAHLLQYGGHANAAGCSFRPENLDQFRENFYQACANFAAQQKSDIVTTDIEVTLDMMDTALYEHLKILEPFGPDNHRPLFMLDGITLQAPLVMSGKHLKWRLRPDLEMIYWDGVHQFQKADTYTVAYTLKENIFRGERKVQLMVKALHVASPS